MVKGYRQFLLLTGYTVRKMRQFFRAQSVFPVVTLQDRLLGRLLKNQTLTGTRKHGMKKLTTHRRPLQSPLHTVILYCLPKIEPDNDHERFIAVGPLKEIQSQHVNLKHVTNLLLP
jgi:hypothetical protein